MTDLLPHLRPADPASLDLVALGEVMLRLDPGEGRVRNARSFSVWEGGGEYNVARALAKVFQRRAGVVTALPDNEVGRLVDDLMAQGGVDRRHLIWRPFDGIGRNTRVGLNFTERGFGLRAALGVSDRACSAASQIAPGEIDWDAVFADGAVRWLHTGGIFAALSADTAAAAIEAVEAARRHGVVVSYDLNYRASLWNSHPDPDAARRVNRRIAASVDVMIGDAHGFETCLGLDMSGLPAGEGPLDPAPFAAAAERYVGAYAQTRVVAATLRSTASASRNGWTAAAWSDGVLHRARAWPELEILDRVGGGDGFASGLIHALLDGRGLDVAVNYGAAHGALAMTTPGDSSMAGLAEVDALVAGGDARTVR